MRCDAARERIQNWFDATGAAAMPAEIGAHLHDCAECRNFVQRWNRIEVGLQAVRDQVSAPHSSFRARLNAKLTDASATRPLIHDLPMARLFRPAQYAMATASVLALIALAAHFAGAIRLAIGGPARPTIAVIRGAQPDRASGATSIDDASR